MANLKLDLVNKLNNDKFYSELELVRLAQEPRMNYEKKINKMNKILKKLANINSQLELTEQYFKEPTAEKEGAAPTNQPVRNRPVLAQGQGQSHEE